MGKDYQLRHKYGITLAEYIELLEKQEHRCAVCDCMDGSDKHNGLRTKQLSIDHDHQTGIIRGLLCNDCNRAIGQMQDSSVLLRKAAEYLEAFEARNAKSAELAEACLADLMNLE